MKGSYVQGAREALGLSRVEFADVLGVHLASVYRWESMEEVRIDPLHLRIVEMLDRLPEKRLHEIGIHVKSARRVHGPLFALHELLRLGLAPTTSRPRSQARHRQCR